MTRPIFEPAVQREIAAAQYASQQLFRRPAPTPGASGLSFCYAEKSSTSSGSVPSSGNYVVDFHVSTGFKTNDAATFPGIYHDTGKTPEYGIRIPANFLVEVAVWLQLAGDIANGPHSVDWVIDSSYSVFQFGPAPSAEFTPSASSPTGLADDHTAPRALTRVDYMGDTADFTVGVIHRWYNWTTDPLNFLYGIDVTLIGALPT